MKIHCLSSSEGDPQGKLRSPKRHGRNPLWCRADVRKKTMVIMSGKSLFMWSRRFWWPRANTESSISVMGSCHLRRHMELKWWGWGLAFGGLPMRVQQQQQIEGLPPLLCGESLIWLNFDAMLCFNEMAWTSNSQSGVTSKVWYLESL